MTFIILPISSTNPHIDFLNIIEHDGLKWFVNYSETINSGSKDDINFYKKYLNEYLFQGIMGTEVWLEFINCLSIDKKTINLIDYIDEIKNREKMVNMIVEKYQHHDIDKLLTNEKIASYINIEKSKLFEKLLKTRRFNIIKFLKCEVTREETKSWLTNFYTNQIRFKSLVSVNIIDIYHLDKKLKDINYIAMQLINMFNKNVTAEKIKNFNFPSCEKTFLNELFYLIHKYLDLSVLNIICIKKNITAALEEMNESYETFKIEGDLAKAEMIKLKMEFFSSLKDKLNAIDFNSLQCMKFYKEHTINWLFELKEKNSEIVDEILTNTIEYLGNETHVLIFNEKLFEVFLKILDVDNKLTTSNYIKSKTTMVIATHFDTLESGVKKYVINNLNTFVKSIVHLYVNIATFNDYDVIVYQLEILRLLAPYKKVMFEVVQQDCMTKFVNIFLEIYDYFCKGFLKNVKSIYKKINEDSISEEERSFYIEQKKHGLKWYQQEIFMKNEFLINEYILSSCMHPGNRDKFACILGNLLREFLGPTKNELEVELENQYLNKLSHLRHIYSIFYLLHDNVSLKKALVLEMRYLKSSYISDLLDSLLKMKLILQEEAKEIGKICEFIDEEREKQTKNEEKEIPDEFLDPIMGNLIENPVLLPNSNTFIEKDVIIRHLMHNEENPFTREYLTIKLLEDFNNRPDIQSSILNFKQRLLDWR